MSDLDLLLDNEELGESSPAESPLTQHGTPTSRKNLLLAVGSMLFGPISIGLTLGYSSGAIESLKRDPNMDVTLR